MPTVTLTDTTPAGQPLSTLTLDLLTETITVRELIRSRVYQEVQDYNRRQPLTYRGLVQPTNAEQTLNGTRIEYRLRKPRDIDWKQQFDQACHAFEHNGFFILIDNHQPTSLDEQITLSPTTRVNFVKLLPLVGG